jgi:hypothetical protein
MRILGISVFCLAAVHWLYEGKQAGPMASNDL